MDKTDAVNHLTLDFFKPLVVNLHRDYHINPCSNYFIIYILGGKKKIIAGTQKSPFRTWKQLFFYRTTWALFLRTICALDVRCEDETIIANDNLQYFKNENLEHPISIQRLRLCNGLSLIYGFFDQFELVFFFIQEKHANISSSDFRRSLNALWSSSESEIRIFLLKFNYL